jgi:hypothetical protein
MFDVFLGCGQSPPWADLLMARPPWLLTVADRNDNLVFIAGIVPARSRFNNTVEDVMPEAIETTEHIEQAIRLYRGQKVMLDFDLAALYGVTTNNLNKAVRRNRQRFPRDFLFIIPVQEVTNLIFQSGISRSGWGGRRREVLAFTEQGVAMLSSVLRSERAVLVNIEIMRAFVRLRSLLSAHADLARRLDELEQRYDKQFRAVFDAIRQLMLPPAPPRKQIGFAVREKRAIYRAARKS